MVGAVFIGRDKNIGLLDSAAREGLVENEHFDDLRNAVSAAIMVLESHRVEIYKNRKKTISRISKARIKKAKSERLLEINEVIELIKKLHDESITYLLNGNNNQAHKSIEKSKINITKIDENINDTIEELISENRILNGLATLGITSAVFGHETQSSISLLKQAANNAFENLELKPPNIENSLIELAKVKKYSKQIGNWGKFALARVSKEKRFAKIDKRIHQIISLTIDELRPVLEGANVEIKFEIEDKVMSKVFPLDIEAIVFNLLTNAYQACQQINSSRYIEVKLFRENKNDVKGIAFKDRIMVQELPLILWKEFGNLFLALK